MEHGTSSIFLSIIANCINSCNGGRERKHNTLPVALFALRKGGEGVVFIDAW